MLGRLRAGDARTQRSLRAARPRQRDTRGLPAAHPAATSRRGSAGSACASRCPPSSCACGADGVRGAPGMGRSGAATARGPPAVLHADGRTDGAPQITHPSLQAETPLQVSPDGRPSISFLLASPLQPGGGHSEGSRRGPPRASPLPPPSPPSLSAPNPHDAAAFPHPHSPPPRTRVARFGSVRPGPGAARLGGAAAAETPPERITAGGASSGAGPGGGGTRSRSTRVRALRESRAEPLRRDPRSPVSAASSRWALPFRPWEPPG